MHLLNKTVWFPDIRDTKQHDIVAIGGDLSVERLLLAYASGIFPWFSDGEPITWWSPAYRMVLFPEDFKISKSLKKTLRTHPYKVTWNKDFNQVITNCAHIKRPGQPGTWITDEMIIAYKALHKKGVAMSIEVWDEDDLVGGLYGINLPAQKIFCGESMFSKQNDTSKIAFHELVTFCLKNSYHLIDCQIYNSHLESLGAIEITKEQFIDYLTVN